MITDSPHLYRRAGIAAGHSPDLIERAIEHASLVESRGLEAVLSLKHLAHLTGVQRSYLRSIVARQTDPYEEYTLQGRRVISSPHPPLLAVHRWMLANILNQVPAHSASYAYERRKSIVKCATRHVGARWAVKLDLHNFFGSVDETMVYRVFCGLGYQNLVSFELARLCTRPGIGASHKDQYRSDSGSEKYRVIYSYSNSRRLGFLPQGSPTSGALANLVMRDVDIMLCDLAKQRRLTYTRYADDMTFSSIDEFHRKNVASLIREVAHLMNSRGFVLHKQKTRIVTPGSRMIVLGLLVDGQRVRLPVDSRKRILENIRGVEKFGLADHVKHRKYASMIGFVEHMEGLLAFSYDVDREWTKPIWERWSKALQRSGI
ncbi:reverse transcriptase family protein [Actinomadura roseirufa]|uniref:reverse transcriptase family protein n=1 Tax=Actinomadura roseirufa TaxID=2094049 RepID=UPI00104109DA|nr:reverse transcriptase family protein [Actinomadura roseirufa]